jgi:hypothetical protein
VSKYENFEITNIYNKSLKYLAVVSIILFALSYKNLSYALGFVMGGIACLVNFKLMIKSFEGMVSKTVDSKAFFNGLFLLRWVLVTAVLFGAIKLEYVNLFTTVLGILTIKIVITWETIKNYIKSYKRPE